MYRLSFQGEFMLADKFLYELKAGDGGLDDDFDSTSYEERKLKVREVMYMEDGSLGFLSRELQVRQHTLHGMFRVMSGWSRVRALGQNTKAKAQLLAGPKMLSLKELDDVESLLAYHYIDTFAGFFKRAPIIPHCL